MRVACLQLCSGIDRDANLERVAALLAEAAAAGAELALLPENFSSMGGSQAQKRAMAEDAADAQTLRFLAAQASQHAMAIVGGSLLLRGAAGELCNSAPVFDAGGHLLGLYDKIHLFDMDAEGEHYRESALIEAGCEPLSVPLGAFRLGVSICYDLRFPELYRRYADAGCDLLCNVAAFTAVTGRAHWRTLLRARAIENQAYMLAAAQWGRHPDGRETWGHSMIVDPWGEVLAELDQGDGVIVAEVSKLHLRQLRRSLPALRHRRL